MSSLETEASMSRLRRDVATLRANQASTAEVIADLRAQIAELWDEVLDLRRLRRKREQERKAA